MIQIRKLSGMAILKNKKTTVLQYSVWLTSVIQILKLSANSVFQILKQNVVCGLALSLKYLLSARTIPKNTKTTFL